MDLIQRLKYDWAQGKMIQRIIMVNVFAFITFNVILSLFGLWNQNLSTPLADWLTLPTNLNKLVTRPWTIVTHGFLHGGFFHILFNMLWLYWVGSILEEYIGSKKILPIYMFGVFAGAFFMVAAFNVFPLFSEVKHTAAGLGASAGVMAIIWATVALLPDYRIRMLFLGSLPLIYIAAAYTAIDLISISGTNAGGHFAHIGGAIMGYWFIKLYQRGTDLSVGFNKVIDIFNIKIKRKKQPKMKVMRGGKSKAYNQRYDKTEPTQNNNEDRLNAILDKINDKGYSSLSSKEKEFLKNQSSP